MKRRSAVALGVVLVVVGACLLVLTAVLPLLGVDLWRRVPVWRLWPLIVVAAGLAFVLPPLFVRGRRGLGGLFIPGVPVLATGGILLFTSTLDWWRAWAWLWPLEVLAVAAAFVAAGAYMGVIWLLIPAMVIGANGLLFQFCAITGRWEVWAVMWTIEPLSVGLALLLVGARKRLRGVVTGGAIVCAVGAFLLVGMLALLAPTWLPGWAWLFRSTIAIVLIGGGIALALWGLARTTRSSGAR